MASLIARFESVAALTDAIEAARAAGYQRLEAYAPFPVPEVDAALGFRERMIPVTALIAGVLVAGGAYFMQWYSAVISYPYVVAGKPLHSWPAFLVIPFELGILAAVITAVVVMLAGNRLPQPYHPAFDWPEFERASSDGFFLLIEYDDDSTVISSLQRQHVTEILQRQYAAQIKELTP
ncbi:MAG: DUF3341 domain-containing protein [Nitrococcus sp.]|nr:DUF3341 domain-containing protein [Nitrococcus sp.]